jgi:putative nucleotidyltransferase with HDIG domain
MPETASIRPVTAAIIDGNVQRATDLANMLANFYSIARFRDGPSALAALEGKRKGFLIVDEMAPPRGAPALVRTIRETPALRHLPVIVVATDGGAMAEAAALEAGADAYMERPLKRPALLACASALVNRLVEAEWDHLPENHRLVLRKSVDAFNQLSEHIEQGNAIDIATVSDACSHLVTAVTDHNYRAVLDGVREHDNYSYVHCLRVATYLSVFGHTIGLDSHALVLLASGGLVHDIGKMSIPREVLNKPGKLEGREWDIMKSHVERSVRYLNQQAHVPHAVITVAAQHHEKLDGTGYPKGLKGTELNDLARMAAIVDVFGALTDRRVYKAPMAPEKALDLMAHEMAAGLDMHLLPRFREMLLDVANSER